MELQEKEEKDENHRGKLYRKNPRKKVSINSRIKAIYIIGQRKVFCGQRIPESSCARKGTVNIEILITSRRKGDRRIMQPIRIASETVTRMRKGEIPTAPPSPTYLTSKRPVSAELNSLIS